MSNVSTVAAPAETYLVEVNSDGNYYLSPVLAYRIELDDVGRISSHYVTVEMAASADLINRGVVDFDVWGLLQPSGQVSHGERIYESLEDFVRVAEDLFKTDSNYRAKLDAANQEQP